MRIHFGTGRTAYGPGVAIDLTGDEVATAIMAYLTAKRVNVFGARTISVNGALCLRGLVYVDPEGFVITPSGKKLSGRGHVAK